MRGGEPRARSEGAEASLRADLSEALFASLGEARAALAEGLISADLRLAQLEASLRREPSGALRADRMMIEGASEAQLSVLAQGFGVSLSGRAGALLEAARALSLPVIAGWDVGRAGREPCLKLYANASDASGELRAALGERLAIGGAPHVVGLNLFAGGEEERKAYFQGADGPELARGAPIAEALLRAAGPLFAGAVRSELVGEGPRAFFVALRPASPAALEAAFAPLLGLRWAELRERAPFSPAPPRSIGVSLLDPSSEPPSWTAYLKPADTQAPSVWALEPAALLRAPGAEVGLYLRPDRPEERAYARAGGWALSYRVREGAPSKEALRALLAWAEAGLASGADPSNWGLAPPPWARLTRA